MTSAKKLKKTVEVGSVSVGVKNPASLQGLPHVTIHSKNQLLSPEEQLQSVKSVVALALYIWDKAFDV